MAKRPPPQRKRASAKKPSKHDIVLDRIEKLGARVEIALTRLEEAATKIAVHAVRISQEEERRTQGQLDLSQRIRYSEQRIESLEEIVKAHSNGRAD